MIERPSKRRLVVLSCMVALALVLVLQNLQVVETQVLFFTVRLPRALLLLLTFVLGLMVGLLIDLRRRRNSRST